MADKEDDFSTVASISWPVEWDAVELPDPHVTVLYMGEIERLKTDPDTLEAALKQYGVAPGEVPIAHFSVFGPDDGKVLVAELDLPEDFLTLREIIKAEVVEAGGRDASSYPDYKPHVTIRKLPNGTEELPDDLPEVETVTVLSPMLWWGNDYRQL